MRTDIGSMTPGRVAAQATHGGTELEQYMNKLKGRKTGKDSEIAKLHNQWLKQAGNFGTTIVLDLAEYEFGDRIFYPDGGIESTLDHLKEWSEDGLMVFGKIHDPTYPIKDGDATLFAQVDTGIWLFGDAHEIGEAVQHLELYGK